MSAVTSSQANSRRQQRRKNPLRQPAGSSSAKEIKRRMSWSWVGRPGTVIGRGADADLRLDSIWGFSSAC